MTNYTFRPANRSEAKPLIGFYAESNGGKTKSALLLAKGFAGDMAQVGMIETEAGRGEAYANDPVVGGYRVLPIRGEFAPATYGKAIQAAEEAKLQALIIDSASHEWEGVGGVLAMAAQNQADGKKGPIVWQKPKIDHQREFMLRLMQTPIPLVIVCMRAKYPMLEKKTADGKKEWIRSDKLEPKQADDILFEMFAHGWFDQETHAFHGTKYTLDELREVIKDGEKITVETGQRLAAWAKGVAPKDVPAQPSVPPAPAPAPAEKSKVITLDQAVELAGLLAECDDRAEAEFLKIAKLGRLDTLAAGDFDEALDWVKRRKAKKAKAA